MAQGSHYAHHEQHASFNMGDLSSQSQGSSDPAGIDGVSKSLDLGPNPSSFASLPGTGSGMLDPLVALQSLGSKNMGRQYPLYDWYHTRDGPWDPVSKTLPLDGRDDAQISFEHGTSNSRPGIPPAFFGYRSRVVPSECDTVIQPSDSGYESATRHSVGISSIYGDVDRSADAQSVIAQISDFRFQGIEQNVLEASDIDSQQDLWKQPGSSQSAQTTTNAENRKILVCENCKKLVKTQSELNKHKQRHTKPFHCDVPDCKRKDGFSTTNDLDRHKKSVHRKYDLSGHVYRCSEGPCGGKSKIWPRADNFRYHLKRVHQMDFSPEDDLKRYVFRNTPADDELQHGVGPSTRFDSQSGESCDTATSVSRAWIGVDRTLDHGLHHTGAGHPVHVDNFDPSQSGLQSEDDPSFSLVDTSEDGQDDDDARSVLEIASEGGNLELDQVKALDEPHATPEQDHIRLGQDCIPPGFLSNHPIAPLLSQTQSSDSRKDEVINLLDTDQPTTPAEQSQPDSPELLCKASPAEPLDDTHSESPRLPEILDKIVTSTLSSKSDGTDQPKSADSGEEGISLNDEGKETDLIKSLQFLQDKGLLEKLVEQLGYQKAKGSAVKPKKHTATPSQAGENQITCPHCSKTFHRRCELRKHMKRHEKPYGCTYLQCRKRFGSKNDWKRHENSQHFQLEVWKCDEKVRGSSNSTCEKVCHRRETFKTHLQKDHDIQDTKVIEQKWEICRLGRNCEARFWCGFCRKIIQVKQKGLEAWTEKFDHIGDHYSGRNLPKMVISEWKNVDPEQPQTNFSSPEAEDGSPPCCSPEPETPSSIGGGLPSAAGKRKGGPAVDNHESNGTKRARRSSQADDTSHGQPDPVWNCCQCGYQWFSGTTNICINDGCNRHDRCDDCLVECLPKGKEII